MVGNIKIIRNGNPKKLAKIDKKLYDRCMKDLEITFKGKAIFTMMLTKPQKIYTEYDFITPLDKIDSVTTGLKELVKHNYIKKIKDGYVVKELFVSKKLAKNSGYVYIIRDNYNNYKIGLAKNVAKRFNELKTAMPYDPIVIKILHCFNMYETEKKLHGIFKSKRLNGEWFKLDSNDIEFIKSLDSDIK